MLALSTRSPACLSTGMLSPVKPIHRQRPDSTVPSTECVVSVTTNRSPTFACSTGIQFSVRMTVAVLEIGSQLARLHQRPLCYSDIFRARPATDMAD